MYDNLSPVYQIDKILVGRTGQHMNLLHEIVMCLAVVVAHPSLF